MFNEDKIRLKSKRSSRRPYQ